MADQTQGSSSNELPVVAQGHPEVLKPGVDADVMSPTLLAAGQDKWPRSKIPCMNCPHAVWMQTGTDLKCYCRVMYRLSWSKGDQTEILACDGPMIGQEAQE